MARWPVATALLPCPLQNSISPRSIHPSASPRSSPSSSKMHMTRSSSGIASRLDAYRPLCSWSHSERTVASASERRSPMRRANSIASVSTTAASCQAPVSVSTAPSSESRPTRAVSGVGCRPLARVSRLAAAGRSPRSNALRPAAPSRVAALAAICCSRISLDFPTPARSLSPHRRSWGRVPRRGGRPCTRSSYVKRPSPEAPGVLLVRPRRIASGGRPHRRCVAGGGAWPRSWCHLRPSVWPGSPDPCPVAGAG